MKYIEQNIFVKKIIYRHLHIPIWGQLFTFLSLPSWSSFHYFSYHEREREREEKMCPIRRTNWKNATKKKLMSTFILAAAFSRGSYILAERQNVWHRSSIETFVHVCNLFFQFYSMKLFKKCQKKPFSPNCKRPWFLVVLDLTVLTTQRP